MSPIIWTHIYIVFSKENAVDFHQGNSGGENVNQKMNQPGSHTGFQLASGSL